MVQPALLAGEVRACLAGDGSGPIRADTTAKIEEPRRNPADFVRLRGILHLSDVAAWRDLL